MARRRRRNYPRSSGGGNPYAERHVDAEALSEELGGTDGDVKAYFFGLSGRELTDIFDEYGDRYGAGARKYAVETLPMWRWEGVQMSGRVATRLFELLPPRMPLSEKYRLTENLWKHVGPSSHKVLRVGGNASADEVLQLATSHISEVVTRYKIPDSLEKRFNWLSAGDVHVKQAILNQLRESEIGLVTEGVRTQFPVLQRQATGADGQYTQRLAHIVTVGKHQLELLFDATALGVRLEEPGARVTDSSPSTGSAAALLGWYAWVLYVVGAAAGGILLIAVVGELWTAAR